MPRPPEPCERQLLYEANGTRLPIDGEGFLSMQLQLKSDKLTRVRCAPRVALQRASSPEHLVTNDTLVHLQALWR